MKTRIALVFSAFLLLLAIGIASAQPGVPADVKSADNGEYAIRSGESSLVIDEWQVTGIASGGEYQLTPLSTPSDQAGCICDLLLLPMIRH